MGSAHLSDPRRPYSRLSVDLVFAPGGKVVGFLDLVGPDTLRNSNHPQELVDVVSALDGGNVKTL